MTGGGFLGRTGMFKKLAHIADPLPQDFFSLQTEWFNTCSELNLNCCLLLEE